MRHILLSLVTLVTIWAVTGHASFYVYGRIQHNFPPEGPVADDQDDVVACPTTKDNCKCWGTGRVATIPNYDSIFLPSGFFPMQFGGMCEVNLVNFYEQPDGTWLYFREGGTSPLGRCRRMSGENTCVTSPFTSAFVAKHLGCDGIC
jgi:hypothetical protein